MTSFISPEEWQQMMADDLQAEEDFRATDYESVSEYYEAEDTVRDNFDTEPLASTDEVIPFIISALNAVGYMEGPWPIVHFDADDSDKVGLVNEDGIHLHPELINPWILVHELAHWLDPGLGHSARWAHTYVELVTVAIGREEGEALRAEFRVRGLPCHVQR